MLETSLDKLPEHYGWSYFMPFFWLILLFAVVTEFVTFGLWNLLQYLSNITGFCCRDSGNFHQSCKIFILMKACDINEEHIKYRMILFFSLFPMSRLRPNLQRCFKVRICCVSGKPNQLFSLEGWAYTSSGACAAPRTELPRIRALLWLFALLHCLWDHAQQLFQNILWFLSSASIAAVCNP